MDINIGIIIGAALADSINPCVFGVLIFLLAFMTKVFKTPAKMLFCGLFYSSFPLLLFHLQPFLLPTAEFFLCWTLY